MTFSNMYGANQIWYAYDGDGRRVGKFELLVLSPTSTDFRSTIYARDAFGNTVAEYCSPDCAYGSLGTTYYTTDVLGSTRVETDAGGNVKRRYDYLPFGQEIPAQWPAAVGTRTVGMRYQLSASTDAMPAAKFTGKERDAETGLDFFESRYYSSAQGRFTSPDEFKGGFLDAFSGQSAFQAGPLPYADITDPQTLNKYAYVRNNPLRYTDPNAHCLEDACVVEAILGYTAATAVAGGVIYYAQRLGTAIGEFFNAKKSEREVTPPANSNKPGTRGKEDHQQTANEEADRVNGEREVRIPTPGGKKDTRVADAAGTNPQTG